MSRFDSLIFDMDGTLWDAVDSYCEVWNHTIDKFGTAMPKVTRERLAPLMGKHLDEIYTRLGGPAEGYDKFMIALGEAERNMMPRLGGRLYDGVRETLEELAASGIRLFMVSNCEKNGLPNFLRFTGMEHLFVDTRSFGQTNLGKDKNIAALVDEYHLERPLYIGDVAGDCTASHNAGVPFAWARYGFGDTVPEADYELNAFTELPKLCVK